MSDELSQEQPLTQNNQRVVFNPLRMVVTAVSLCLWIILMLLVFGGVRLFAPAKLPGFFQCFHRGCCRILALRYQTHGQLCQHRPTLFLSNHISYLDIFVLGGAIPGHFIAKSEVASWPVLGWLAKVQNTLFFERKGRQVRSQLSVMATHFNGGGNLILFPEGTSTEGEHVEPFKSSLLQSVEQSQCVVMIQPVTIAYCSYRGKTMTPQIRDKFAWYGDMPFASHLFGAMAMGPVQISVVFHAPIQLTDFSARKDCAFYAWQQVFEGLNQQLNQSIHSKTD